MTRIVFDSEVESTPYDRDGTLTSWRLVGSSTYPTAVSGSRFRARSFDGTSGYEADDLGSVLLGIAALTWRMIIRPDFDALAGTDCTIIARGRGGATAPEYWPWDLRLAVNGGATQATLTLAWQDETGAVVMHALATFDRPPVGAWTMLGVCREPVASGTYLRLSIEGRAVVELDVEDQITATPGEVVTLGCRRNGSGFDRFYVGDVELLDVTVAASTPLQERHAYHAHALHPEQDRETLRAYLTGLGEVIPLRGSTYDRYRLRPWSELIGSVSSAIETRTDAALPDNAYGARLAQWETALGLPDANALAVAERQGRAAAAITASDGFSLGFLSDFTATLLRTDDPAEAFRLVTGILPEYLWLGTETDEINGSTLTANGVVYEAGDSDTVALSCPWGRRALALGIGLVNFYQTANAAIGNVTNAAPVAIVIGFILRDLLPTTFHLLAGNRETGTLNGWEIHSSNAATPQAHVLVDDGPNQAVITLATSSATIGTPHFVALAFNGATVYGASEASSGSAAFPFNPTSATPVGIGAYRATSPEITANADVIMFAVIRGEMTPRA